MTCDQQLYKVVVDIIIQIPDSINTVCAVLGEMNFLMDFIGCIGVL